MIAARKVLHAQQLETSSNAITDKILRSIEYQKAACIMSYLSINNEVDTRSVIAHAQSAGKKVAIPYTERDVMHGVLYKPTLITGAFGISVPKEIEIVPPDEIDYIIVPGVAFDLSGGRIGYGKGYFDRYLACCKGFKEGVCYQFQIVEELELCAHDIKMDRVVTE